MTVDQGKQINTELKHKAESTAATVREDLLEARMVAMTPEERAAFVAKAAEIAQKVDARAAAAAQVGDASPVETVAAATPATPDEPVAPQTPGDAAPNEAPQTPGA